jgi:hypothetical protein
MPRGSNITETHGGKSSRCTGDWSSAGWWAAFGAAYCLAVCGGCQRLFPGQPIVADVEGVVLLDGQPVAGARVLFVPFVLGLDDDEFEFSFATTDERGHFQLSMGDRTMGALSVRHRVLISKISGNKNQILPGQDESGSSISSDPGVANGDLVDWFGALTGMETRVELIPEFYNKHSELTFDVPHAVKAFAQIELSSIDPHFDR